MYKFPFQKTIPLTLDEAKKAERNTICSACCTSMGDVPFVDAAIIILYASMLGANDMFSMVTTSLSPLMAGVFSLLATMFTGRQNYQKTILQMTVLSLVMFAIAFATPSRKLNFATFSERCSKVGTAAIKYNLPAKIIMEINMTICRYPIGGFLPISKLTTNRKSAEQLCHVKRIRPK